MYKSCLSERVISAERQIAVCLMRRLRRAERDRQGLAQGLPDGESIGDTGLGRSQGNLSQPVGWLAQPGGARLQGKGKGFGSSSD